MRRVVDRLQAVAGEVRVDLRRREVGVPEQLLHGPEVGPTFEEVRGVRMTQHVRMQRPAVGERVRGDHTVRLAGRDLPTATREEHGIGR